MWELRLLGPVELWVAGRRLDLGPAKQRAVLAALAADAGRTVPFEARMRYTRTWIRDDRYGWRILAAHAGVV